MLRVLQVLVLVLFSSIVAVCLAEESSIDKYIKELKSKDAEIRANAAFELGCG